MRRQPSEEAAERTGVLTSVELPIREVPALFTVAAANQSFAWIVMIALGGRDNGTLLRRGGVGEREPVRAPFNKQKEQEHSRENAAPACYPKSCDLPVHYKR